MDQRIFGKHFTLVSENVSNKDLFTMIASEFNVRAPRFEAGKIALNLDAFASEIFCEITGKRPQLTKEIVRSAQNSQKYSNKQIKNTLFLNLSRYVRPFRTLVVS